MNIQTRHIRQKYQRIVVAVLVMTLVFQIFPIMRSQKAAANSYGIPELLEMYGQWHYEGFPGYQVTIDGIEWVVTENGSRTDDSLYWPTYADCLLTTRWPIGESVYDYDNYKGEYEGSAIQNYVTNWYINANIPSIKNNAYVAYTEGHSKSGPLAGDFTGWYSGGSSVGGEPRQDLGPTLPGYRATVPYQHASGNWGGDVKDVAFVPVLWDVVNFGSPFFVDGDGAYWTRMHSKERQWVYGQTERWLIARTAYCTGTNYTYTNDTTFGVRVSIWVNIGGFDEMPPPTPVPTPVPPPTASPTPSPTPTASPTASPPLDTPPVSPTPKPTHTLDPQTPPPGTPSPTPPGKVTPSPTPWKYTPTPTVPQKSTPPPLTLEPPTPTPGVKTPDYWTPSPTPPPGTPSPTPTVKPPTATPIIGIEIYMDSDDLGGFATRRGHWADETAGTYSFGVRVDGSNTAADVSAILPDLTLTGASSQGFETVIPAWQNILSADLTLTVGGEVTLGGVVYREVHFDVTNVHASGIVDFTLTYTPSGTAAVFRVLVPGDVSKDGYVNSTDLTQVFNMLKGSIPIPGTGPPGAYRFELANLSPDGNINSTDYTLMMNLVKGSVHI